MYTKQFNEGYKKHNTNERPIYLTFAASKMSNAVKPNTVVEFTDFMGRVHKVAVRNRTEMQKAMTFFAVLKKESARINEILADYPVRMGRIEKRFIPQVKRELKAIGLSTKAIEIVLM
ncbi:hypothetical protein UFOVP449_16 [uncultured Caudovirales phage]|uniref:Uncharacterized protein n=1 Tax=uncultured Caudovirales phage TaxID=2100421 RepID=A0A6J5MEV9_9CAUD|nr:hypothetical protein UFOVP449_16 [uncultured Caudovirales phage]